MLHQAIVNDRSLLQPARLRTTYNHVEQTEQFTWALTVPVELETISL